MIRIGIKKVKIDVQHGVLFNDFASLHLGGSLNLSCIFMYIVFINLYRKML